MNTFIVTCPSCAGKNRIPAYRQHLTAKCGKCGQSFDLREHARPIELTDHEFKDFLARATLPVMVDFYSPTCGPCKTLAPLIHRLNREYFKKVHIATIDTSLHSSMASHYQIKGVPTLLFFHQNQLIDQVVGALPEPQLRQKLDQLAAKS